MAKQKMMLLLLSVWLLSPMVWAKKQKNLTLVKVQVVAESQGFHGKYQEAGLAGAIDGTRTFATATLTTAIINGDHALLKCYENHHSCNILGVGEYDAEMETKGTCKGCGESVTEPDIWIKYVRPVDHVVFREHWKVVGSW
jgi:hypothetical protein